MTDLPWAVGLIRYKIVIHAFVDGKSHLVTGIQASNNNHGTMVLLLFHRCHSNMELPVTCAEITVQRIYASLNGCWRIEGPAAARTSSAGKYMACFCAAFINIHTARLQERSQHLD